jgi:hypothetical protein
VIYIEVAFSPCPHQIIAAGLVSWNFNTFYKPPIYLREHPKLLMFFSLLRAIAKKKSAFALFSDMFVESGYVLVVGGGWF